MAPTVGRIFHRFFTARRYNGLPGRRVRMTTIQEEAMSEYALYLATVLLLVISIVTSKLAFDVPDNPAIQHATFEPASTDHSLRNNFSAE